MKTFFSVLFAGIFSIGFVLAGGSSNKGNLNIDGMGLMAHGYDVVSYFEGRAVEGQKKYETSHKDATYRFSNQKNLEAFKANPEKYVPEFGGYCAYGVSKGRLYDIDPEAFTIYKGNLYLNLDKDVQKRWESEKDENIAEANNQWPQIFEKP